MDGYRDRVAYFLEVRGMRPRVLRVDELAAYGWPATGWKVTLATPVGDREVDALLPLDYPYEPARIGVRSLREGRPGAHIADGLLCLTDTTECHSVRGDEAILERDLGRAAARFADDPETVAVDRAGEFADYWNREVSTPRIYSLLTPDTAFGSVAAWHGKPFILVAPDDDAARHWLRVRFGKQPADLSHALYLPGDTLDAALEHGSDLRDLVDRTGSPALIAALDDVAANHTPSAALVFRLPGPFALVGALLRHGRRDSGAYKRKARVPGFRPGREPRKMLIDGYFADAPRVEHHALQRVDRDWIITRGGEPTPDRLNDATVCLVGVGSLGSAIARMLIKAGVGGLILIDPDMLSWDNIARHELGGRFVGQYKAEALAQALREDFPFARVDARATTWQNAYRDDPALFDVDVLLSTTGDWPVECQLTDLLRAQSKPPMVFGWIEPHAAAAHALIVRGEGGCLACGMFASGEFAARAIDWSEPQSVRIAGCGASYTPYSDLAASRARAMIAGEVLSVLTERETASTLATEIYGEVLRTQYGGTSTNGLAQRLGRTPLSHGDFVRSAWPEHSECPACARKEARAAA